MKKTETPFDQTAYNMAYAKANLERHSLNLNRLTEGDIIEHLHKVDESFATYVKRLIREDMARKKQ